MTAAVLTSKRKWQEIGAPGDSIAWIVTEKENEFFSMKADVYLNLLDDAAEKDYTSIQEPLIINSVVATLKDIKGNNKMVRMNGWNGFLARDQWELAGTLPPPVDQVLAALNKKYLLVHDDPGYISARIWAMIINEAYYAVEENISTPDEVNIAMKLGTNYPAGPFEMARIIGVQNIYSLLTKLSAGDTRYTPSSRMKDEILQA
jgi:3-hydroxybutyryl-CoA dehydrogenase